MAQSTLADSDPADIGGVPLQPTGSGTTDLEIGKLQSAVADGVPDPEIETGIVDGSAATDRATTLQPDGTAEQAAPRLDEGLGNQSTST